MAEAIKLSVVGINQTTVLYDVVLPTFGIRAYSETNAEFPTAVTKVVVPNPPMSGTSSNYWVTETLDQILAELNATTTEDLAVVGNLTVSGYIDYSTGAAITAFATGGQASATQLAAQVNNLTTVATAGDSVKLPVSVVGYEIVVKNNGAAAADVFPATSGTINGGSANAAISIKPNETIIFMGSTTTNWETRSEVLSAGTVYSNTVTEKTAATGITNTNFTYFTAGQIIKRVAVAINASATMADGDMKKGYITSTSAAGTAITSRTATQLATELSATAGATYEFVIDNVAGASTVTFTPGAGLTAVSAITGGTDMTLATGEIGIFKIVFVSTTVAQVCRQQ